MDSAPGSPTGMRLFSRNGREKSDPPPPADAPLPGHRWGRKPVYPKFRGREGSRRSFSPDLPIWPRRRVPAVSGDFINGSWTRAIFDIYRMSLNPPTRRGTTMLAGGLCWGAGARHSTLVIWRWKFEFAKRVGTAHAANVERSPCKRRALLPPPGPPEDFRKPENTFRRSPHRSHDLAYFSASDCRTSAHPEPVSGNSIESGPGASAGPAALSKKKFSILQRCVIAKKGGNGSDIESM